MRIDLRKDSIPALTGLRAIAAYLVFAHHLVGLPAGTYWPIRALVSEGHIGVTLFFTLSGFLIALRYSESVTLTTGWFADYMRNRFARILPVYFSLTLGVALITRERDWATWLANFTLLPGFFNPKQFLIPQAWSLAVEELFYLSAPVVFILLRKAWRPHAVYAIIAAIGLALLAIGMAYGPEAGFFGDPKHFMLRTFFGHSVEFLFGILAARSMLKAGPDVVVARLRKITKVPLTWFGLVGAYAIVCVLFASRPDGSTADGLWSPIGIALNNFVLPPFVAILIIGLVSERTWLSRALSLSPVQLLGRASFAFYLLHYGTYAGYLLDRLKLDVWVVFLVLNAASIAILLGFEEPMRNRIRVKRRPQGAPVLSSSRA